VQVCRSGRRQAEGRSERKCSFSRPKDGDEGVETAVGTNIYIYIFVYVYKGKVIPLQVRCGPEGG